MKGNLQKYIVILLATLLLLSAAPLTAHAACAGDEHSFGDWQTRTERTCTKDGVEARTCTACGEEETRTVLRLGHDFATEYTVDLQPTCIDPGRKSHHCLRCSDKKDITVIEATDHSPGEWVVEIEASCTQDGLRNLFCTVCAALVDSEMIDKTPHGSGWTIVTPATCAGGGSESFTCPDCGLVHRSTATPALPHTPSDWIVTAPATCTAPGARHSECTGCGEVLATETLPALGHSFGEWATVTEATCAAPGSRSHTCDTCGIAVAEELPALAHPDADGDCLCDTCGAQLTGYNFITAIFNALMRFFNTILAMFR